MPRSRNPRDDADGTFSSAWDKIQRRNGRKRRHSNDSTAQPNNHPRRDDPPPSPLGGPESPLPSPLPNINSPLPRIPPSWHSTKDTRPDISGSQSAETNDPQQHDTDASPQPESPRQPEPSSPSEPLSETEPPQESSSRQQSEPEALNMQQVVTNLSTLVEGFLDCLQTARVISVVLVQTIYFFFPIFIIRGLLKAIVVCLIIVNTLMFASERIHRGFCHIAPQLTTPLVATALTDMAMCVVYTQDAPSVNSDDTLDGFVAMIPPVWDFLSKNSDMIVREFPPRGTGFKDAAREMQVLENDFTEKQKHHWNVIDDFISKFNNVPSNVVWYRFLDPKVYDAQAHCSHLISILEDAQNHTRQALANLPTDKSTGIYDKLFNLEAMAFYENIRDAFMQTSGSTGLSVVYDDVINSWTVGTKTRDFLANQLAKRRRMLEKDELWLRGKIDLVRRRREELELGRGKERWELWDSQIERIEGKSRGVAKGWRWKLKRYFVEEVVDMD